MILYISILIKIGGFFKMKIKRILAIILSVIILFCALPFGVFTVSAVTSDYYTYTVSNGKATITDCKQSISGTVAIPSTLGGYPVTNIGDYAFMDCVSLTGLIIPEGITTIGMFAFRNCSLLNNITLPESIVYIGNRAFENCYLIQKVNIPTIVAWCNINFVEYSNPIKFSGDLYIDGIKTTNISIPKGVTKINNGAFFGYSSLTNITIPDTVTSIGEEAFYGCSSLTNIFIPNNITFIGDFAFSHCDSLESISIGDNIARIGHSAFKNTAYYNDKNNWDSDVLYISNYLIEAIPTLENCLIRDNTRVIADYAFEDCYLMENISIPDGVIHIGIRAFSGCSALKNIKLPKNLKNISSYTFEYCTTLTNIIIPENVTSIEKGAFSNCVSLININLPTNISHIDCYIFENTAYYNDNNNWDNGVLYIGEYLIEASLELKKCVIKDTTKLIASYAFWRCESLTNITIPESVIFICDGAFKFCSSLKIIKMPNSIKQIGEEIFYGCNLHIYCNVGNVSDLFSSTGYAHKCFGDFDNDRKLSSIDTVMMRKSLLGLFDENYDKKVADINQDNDFNILDLVRLKKKIAGIIA